MRRTALAVTTLLLALFALPAFAVQSRNVVDDVIKMAKSGVAEETMLDFVAKAPRYDVNADDVVAMSEANVPRTVIRAVVKGAENSEPGRYDSTRSTVVVAPAYGYYPYYGYPYYDPFWYGPSLSIGFGFGFGHYGHYGHYNGGFHHRHW